MGLFPKEQPFPKWIAFGAGDKYDTAQRINLGPGDGVAVRFHGRVVPMDLMRIEPEAVLVQDPDQSSYFHDWDDVMGYWKRIK